MSNMWDNEPFLDRMEKERAIRKLKGQRLTFDCLNLRFRDDRAVCSLGKHLGQAEDGSLLLVSVLRGVTSGVCKNCKDFNTE